jgi:GAF domain-containing protein
MNDDEEPHAFLVIETKKPVAINDAFNDERVNRNHMNKWGVRSVLVIPLIIKDEVTGVIFFNYQRSNFAFDDTTLILQYSSHRRYHWLWKISAFLKI